MLQTTLSLMLWLAMIVACGEENTFIQKEKEKSEDILPQDEIVENSSEEGENNGEESQTPEYVEMDLRQHEAGKVDILWIIDNSKSMQPFQNSLRENFQAFINQVSPVKLDFNIGVTSTDVCPERQPSNLEGRLCPGVSQSPRSHRGFLVGNKGRKVLTESDPDLVTLFQKYANLGTGGSSFEHGLTAAKMAVERSVAGENEGFIRKDAFLSVIIVSDEEDDGVGLSQTNDQGVNHWERGDTRYRFTAKDLMTSLSNLKGDTRFSVSTIVGTKNAQDELCGEASEEGKEYLEAAKLSGGLQASICSTNWNETLRVLGEDLNSQIESIKLKFVPEKTTLRVKVNEQIYPFWFYNSHNNTVQFETGRVPTPGAYIHVSYQTRQK